MPTPTINMNTERTAMGAGRVLLMGVLAGVAGCVTLGVASPLLFISPLFGLHLHSPVTLQIPPVPIALHFALLGYLAGAFLGASLPWMVGSEKRGPFPLLVAVGALAGGAVGFLFFSKMKWMAMLPMWMMQHLGPNPLWFTINGYIPVALFGVLGGWLACLIPLSRPTRGVNRFLLTLLGFGLIAAAIRFGDAPPAPTPGADAERMVWSKRYMGPAYRKLADSLQNSPVLKNRMGPAFVLVPGPTIGSVMYGNDQRFLRADFLARGPTGQTAITAWIMTPYRSSAAQMYEIGLNSSSGTLFLTPEGILDPQRMAPNGKTLAVDLRDRILALFKAKKFADVVAAFEHRPMMPATTRDPMMEPEVLLTCAKSYEFLKKNTQASAQYALAAMQLQMRSPGGHEKAIHFAKKALSLDPGNFVARNIIEPPKAAAHHR